MGLFRRLLFITSLLLCFSSFAREKPDSLIVQMKFLMIDGKNNEAIVELNSVLENETSNIVTINKI
jgi:hypothetical protein